MGLLARGRHGRASLPSAPPPTLFGGLDRVLEFTGALRQAGVPVAVSDDIDALRALEHVELKHKGAVRAALATTLVKTQTHRAAFDTLFDLYFGTGRGAHLVAERDEAHPLRPRRLRRGRGQDEPGGRGRGARGPLGLRRGVERFLTEHGAAVGPKTTMLILGDGRTNYRPGGPTL